VQAEHVAHGLHLGARRFVQADPDEGVLALVLEFVDLVQRRGVGVFAGKPFSVDVDNRSPPSRARRGRGCAWHRARQGEFVPRRAMTGAMREMTACAKPPRADNSQLGSCRCYAQAAIRAGSDGPRWRRPDRRFPAPVGALVSSRTQLCPRSVRREHNSPQGRRHRCRRPDRLQPAVPPGERIAARRRPARSNCVCSRSSRR